MKSFNFLIPDCLNKSLAVCGSNPNCLHLLLLSGSRERYVLTHLNFNIVRASRFSGRPLGLLWAYILRFLRSRRRLQSCRLEKLFGILMEQYFSLHAFRKLFGRTFNLLLRFCRVQACSIIFLDNTSHVDFD